MKKPPLLTTIWKKIFQFFSKHQKNNKSKLTSWHEVIRKKKVLFSFKPPSFQLVASIFEGDLGHSEGVPQTYFFNYGY